MASADSSRRTSIPRRSSTVQVVLLGTFLDPFSVALVGPELPVFQSAFDLTDAKASLLPSVVLVGIFPSPVVGLLADRQGPRGVFIGSLVEWSPAGGAITIGFPFPVALALRFVQGTALAGIGITTTPLISGVFEDVQRNAVPGINAAVLWAGAAAFPIVGVCLVAVPWTAPFAMYPLGPPVALLAFDVLDEPSGRTKAEAPTFVG